MILITWISHIETTAVLFLEVLWPVAWAGLSRAVLQLILLGVTLLLIITQQLHRSQLVREGPAPTSGS